MISLLIGLGNPGKKYHETRHNLGFDLIDLLSDRFKASKGLTTDLLVEYQAEIGDRQIIMAKPMTYMNLSGLAVADLLQRYSLAPDEILVLVDDFTLPLGTLRFRANGSDGGHNGLASIIEQLQSDKFPRVRLGIGPADEKLDTAEFVLSKFEPDQIGLASRMLDSAAEAVTFAITNRLELAMSKYNRPPVLPEQE